ncbi:protein GLE1 [Cucumis melo var. makuwa]|uniref:mRNA export factor GLE1 n=2 Tax=Cucumis melo TaxID=3656 RepID=A0A5A7SUC8_CUCMM|nr:protein GLE1 [Cucumis melo var. makuwa]TYK15672.1 protein GLE1 [Cucumis melo var. makuwa]
MSFNDISGDRSECCEEHYGTRHQGMVVTLVVSPPVIEAVQSLLIDTMSPVKLTLRCPSKIGQVIVDPDPDFSFDDLRLELHSLEEKLNKSTMPFKKTCSRDFPVTKTLKRSSKPFIMGVYEDELEEIFSDEVVCDPSSNANRFNCDGIFLSDSEDSDNESTLEAQAYLKEDMDLVESSLAKLTHDHMLNIKEEIRNQLGRLETDLTTLNEKSSAAISQIEKYYEARREADRRLDTQYQREIAEGLDKYLTTVQHHHEQISQREERKIRSDAAFEEAKRKEKAILEDKKRQEKLKAEAEAKAKAEEAMKAAIEAERRAAKEAAETEAAENLKKVDTVQVQETMVGSLATKPVNSVGQPKGTAPDETFVSKSPDSMVRASKSALALEPERLQKLKEVEEGNQALRLSSNKDFSTYERHIARLIKQIGGTKENVRTKTSEILKIFMAPLCPQTISIAAFAKKIVSQCESPHDAFALSHVIVLVTSQAPSALVLVLAELHRACIYTVPKHIQYSAAAYESKESYYKTIGFREVDGKMESVEDYLTRLEAYVKLYAALIQTEIPGVRNLHGLEEGWAWLARFLNAIPPNLFTAASLNAFLKVAGFAMYRKYKSQFMKLLNIISDNFLSAIRGKGNANLNHIILDIESYLEDRKFLEEPEGKTLVGGSLLSSDAFPEPEHTQEYYRHSSNSYY